MGFSIWNDIATTIIPILVKIWVVAVVVDDDDIVGVGFVLLLSLYVILLIKYNFLHNLLGTPYYT